MRLISDCTIVEVDDTFGKGIAVWRSGGYGFLGRFQEFGMKVCGEPKFEGEPEIGDGDLLMMFADRQHMDSSWQLFRRHMLRTHLVYIPDDYHYPEREDGGPWPVIRWLDRWLPPIAFVLWTINLWLGWISEEVMSFPLVLGGSFAILILAMAHHTIRRGAI